MTETILAGFSRVEITPKLDVPATFEIFDPIYVRALHLRQADRQITLLAADLFLFDDVLFDLTIQHLQDSQIDTDWILPGASHLGTGPAFFQYYIHQPTEALKQFGGEEPYAIAAAEAIRRAKDDLAPTHLSMGVADAQAGLSYNRRARESDGQLRMVSLNEFPHPPDHLQYGEVDLQTGVLYCNRPGRRPIALVNFGCHALSLWDDRGNISADYPGRMAVRLEATGVDSLFFQGALGNVHPVRETSDPCGRIADSLTSTVQQIIGSMETMQPEIHLSQRTISVPVRAVQDVEEARRHWEAQPRDQEGLARYEYWLARQYKTGSARAVTLRAVTLGHCALLHIPGEPFAETGKAIRAASPQDPLLILSNPCPEVGYLPTSQAHEEGGDEPIFAALQPVAESQIRAAAIDLLQGG